MPLLFPLLQRLRMNLKWRVPKFIDNWFMCGCPAPCFKYQHVLYMVWSRASADRQNLMAKRHGCFRNYEASVQCVAVLRPVSNTSTFLTCLFFSLFPKDHRRDWNGVFQSLWIDGGCVVDLRHLDCSQTAPMSWSPSFAALELKHQQ
jgi:hypothetical protein